MKISQAWLRDLFDPGVDIEELARRMSLAGLEVDAISPVAPRLEDVVVARVTSLQKHPQADKLQVCKVADGADAERLIVCGAPNVREGMLAALAKPGAILPGGMTIAEREVRGVRSAGMLCSQKELGVGDDAAGIWDLPPECEVGADLATQLGLDDLVLDFDLTPNRGDCLSALGLARELAALFEHRLTPSASRRIASEDEASVEVRLAAGSACPRYCARVVTGIDPGAWTPSWMTERLRRSGLRPVSPIVDVGNYVMLELGQPLHMFDRGAIKGGIEVRFASEGEKITLLDGRTLELGNDFLLISDAERPLAVAGVMGSEDSGVGSATTEVIIESAFFAPAAVQGRARRLGLHTDAAHRFERGVDPSLAPIAIERATELLLQIAGGKAGPVICADNDSVPQRGIVQLRPERLRRVLGSAIDDAFILASLDRLHMDVEWHDDALEVQPPSFRFDVAREEDLIEEVARLYGYDRLDGRAPAGQLPTRTIDPRQLAERRMRARLVERGFDEVINFSFGAQAGFEAFGIDLAGLTALANPLSVELAVMRPMLLPGLVDALVRNRHRQRERVRLFEWGRVFGADKEPTHIAGVAIGLAEPEQWGQDRRAVDFFDVKGVVEELIAGINPDLEASYELAEQSFLHPGQAAEIMVDQTAIGLVGMLHAALTAELGLREPVVAFELNFDAMPAASAVMAGEIHRQPKIRRDLSLIVLDQVSYAQIRGLIEGTGGNLLTNIWVFDEYTGAGVETGSRSLSIGLALQDLQRTLTDEEADAVITRIVDSLSGQLGVTLRG